MSSNPKYNLLKTSDICDDDDDGDMMVVFMMMMMILGLMGAGRWGSVMMFYRRGEGGKQRQAGQLFSPRRAL